MVSSLSFTLVVVTPPSTLPVRTLGVGPFTVGVTGVSCPVSEVGDGRGSVRRRRR